MISYCKEKGTFLKSIGNIEIPFNIKFLTSLLFVKVFISQNILLQFVFLINYFLNFLSVFIFLLNYFKSNILISI